MLGEQPPDPSMMDDMPELWAEVGREDGATYAELTKDQTENTLRQLLAIAAYCKEHKLELPKDTLNDIDSWIKELINSSKYERSKSKFNSALLRFNINDEILKEIKKLESLSGLFGKHVFDAETGTRPVTDEIINQIYEQTCVRVKHILIPYKPGGADENGNPIEYTEEEFEELVQERIDDLYERIMGGEDYDSLLSESADRMPFDGYTVSPDTNFVPEFLDAAFDMEINEVRKVESDFGMHIMKRYELHPAGQALDIDESRNQQTDVSWRSSIYRNIQTIIMSEELTPYFDKIEINTAETDLFSVISSALMFDCLELLN